MYYLISILLYCVVCGLISKYINESKGYANGFAWGAWLGIIGIIVVLCKPNIAKDQQPQQPESNSIDALERLAQLHEKGVLTDEEFEMKKAKLLDRI